MNLADLADEQLVALVRDQHDEARIAFAELVRRHEPDLARLFRGFHPRLEDVSDLAQELWWRLWRSLSDPSAAGRFDPERGTFGQYLYAMAANVATDWYRRSLRDSARLRRLLSPHQLGEPADEPPATDAFADLIVEDLLDAVARKLDERERVVLALLRQAVPIGHICEQTGLSQPSVWRIQQRLRKAIDEVIR